MLNKKNVSALVLCGDKLLLTKRSLSEDFLPGVWEMPGGKLEKDENDIQALKRELLEETGIEISSNNEIKEVDSESYIIKSKKNNEDKKVVETTYIINFDSFPEVTLSKEHSEYAWVDKYNFDSYFDDKRDMMYVRLKRIFFNS
ncbi:MAG TPA: NUDIX domain-containing protein [Patescibacteria group bacterium]|nr:NUDIX domain-containing protein [Patescibacteria group bacterium]